MKAKISMTAMALAIAIQLTCVGDAMAFQERKFVTAAECASTAAACLPLLGGTALVCGTTVASMGLTSVACGGLLVATGLDCALTLKLCPQAAREYYLDKLAWVGYANLGTEYEAQCPGTALVERFEEHFVVKKDGHTRITKLVMHCSDGSAYDLGERTGTRIDTIACDSGELIGGIRGQIRTSSRNLQRVDVSCRNVAKGTGEYRSIYFGISQPADSSQAEVCQAKRYLSGMRVRIVNPFTDSAFVAGVSIYCKG